MCGEKFFRSRRIRTVKGSPPRARGEVADVLHLKTYDGSPPRARGEVKGKTINEIAGSPPRARGEAIKKSSVCVMTRITPACAGRSNFKENPGLFQKDHPRVCGEKS